MDEQQDSVACVTDPDLDLVETHRLIHALARRMHCLIVAGLVPNKDRVDSLVVFMPNAIACEGVLDLANLSHAMYAKSMRRKIVAYHKATEGQSP
jgi:hypothetical protein